MIEVALGVVLALLAMALGLWRWEARRHASVRAAAARALEAAARAEAVAIEARDESNVRGQILAALQEGVLVANGREIIYANPAATRLLGPARTLPAWIEQPGSARPQRPQVTLHHPVRREVRVETATLGSDALLAVVRDVTDEARLTAVRRDFVANASHEMKTPVGAILATAETLVAALDDDVEGARRFARTLVDEARSLRSLLQSLLDLARLDAPASGSERIDLSAIMGEEIDRARPTAEAKRVTIEADLSATIEVAGSADDLVLLVRNLVSNAVRFASEGGSVSVQLAAVAGEARLAVRDTGIGIASADIPRIFERFYRADPARSRATGGTGLGLAIARGVAEAHGGRISVESELGVGSTFTVVLPLAPVRA